MHLEKKYKGYCSQYGKQSIDTSTAGSFMAGDNPKFP